MASATVGSELVSLTELTAEEAGRVWYMVKNRAYLGEVTMNLKHVGREFIFSVPPLTDLQTWEAANGQLKRKPRLSLDVHSLSGLLFCAGCGGAMSGTNKTQAGRRLTDTTAAPGP